MARNVSVLVLTSGPCAGKTTILSILRQWLEDIGWTVLIVSETATDLISSGATIQRLGSLAFQIQLLKYQIERENRMIEIASKIPSDKVVVICDRGTVDAAAYVSAEQWDQVLKETGHTFVHLRDGRYDGVIFPRSVAIDAPHLYTCDNNPARSETVDEARALDERTLAVWIGAQHISIIDNSTDLHTKASRALHATCRVLGIPEPIEIERKYVIQGFDINELPEHAQPVHIRQDYLGFRNDDAVERVRRRGQNGNFTFYHTIKRHVEEGVNSEVEYQISEEEYAILLERRDPECGTIEKIRYCFVWDNQYFELDCFTSHPGLMLLEIELMKKDDPVRLPPFLEGKSTDVTGKSEYGNYELARSARLA